MEHAHTSSSSANPDSRQPHPGGTEAADAILVQLPDDESTDTQHMLQEVTDIGQAREARVDSQVKQGSDVEGKQSNAAAQQTMGTSMPAPAAPSLIKDARKAAAVAAMAAVQFAAPGQRERVINEAISEAIAPGSVSATTLQSQQAAEQPRLANPMAELGEAVISGGQFVAPDWGAPFPEEDADSVTLDVMKGGSIIDTITLPSNSGHVIFGRQTGADVVVEHQSASRLHAILQFRGREAFLADCASTHGSFLNREALAPLRFHAVHVGSQIRLGQSTRTFIFGAPEEWLQAEGPNRHQRRQAKQEQALRAAAALEESKSKKGAEESMRSALQGDMTWGIAPDAEAVEEEDDGEDIDWRYRYDGGLLTDKQLKLAEAIRSKEFKIQRMQGDAKRLRSKEGDQGELSSGQAAALLHTEQGMEKLHAEVEDLEETLIDSLKASRTGRQAAAVKSAGKAKRRRGRAHDSDSGDEFFDRTIKRHAAPSGGEKAVLTVHTLWDRLCSQQEEANELVERIGKKRAEIEGGRGEGVQEELDAFMTDVAHQRREEELQRIEHELRLTKDQIKQTEQLLDVADPGGVHRARLTKP